MRDPAAIRKQVLSMLARQEKLVHSLLELREQVQGSLFTRYGTCGKETCGCRHHRPHGPYHVLSTRGGKGGAFVYLQPEQASQARTLVAAARSYKKGLASLKALNDELLDVLRQYQRAVARAGGRKLGIKAA